MSLPLKLDYDGERLRYDEVVERLVRCGRRVEYWCEWRSPSGKGWHVIAYVDPPPASAVEVVALQLLLGSDPRREAFNLRRALRVDRRQVSRYWRSRWNVLYGRRDE